MFLFFNPSVLVAGGFLFLYFCVYGFFIKKKDMFAEKKKVVIDNCHYFKDIMTSPERIENVSRELAREVNQHNPQEMLFIQYKGFPGETGDCEFRLLNVTERQICYEFIGTLS